MKLGADTEYVDNENYNINENKNEKFYQSIVKYLPWIGRKDI